MQLQDFLNIARSNQLIEIVGIELLIRAITLLSEARVHDWVCLPLRELLFILKVEEVAEGNLAVVRICLEYFLNLNLVLLLLIIGCLRLQERVFRRDNVWVSEV